MPTKYHCPRCDRKYVEWGAEKLGFRCPDCDVALERIGGTSEKASTRPSLRRPAAPKPAPRSGPVGNDIEGFEEGQELTDDGSDDIDSLGDDDLGDDADDGLDESGDGADGPAELDFEDDNAHGNEPVTADATEDG